MISEATARDPVVVKATALVEEAHAHKKLSEACRRALEATPELPPDTNATVGQGTRVCCLRRSVADIRARMPGAGVTQDIVNEAHAHGRGELERIFTRSHKLRQAAVHMAVELGNDSPQAIAAATDALSELAAARSRAVSKEAANRVSLAVARAKKGHPRGSKPSSHRGDGAGASSGVDANTHASPSRSPRPRGQRKKDFPRASDARRAAVNGSSPGRRRATVPAGVEGGSPAKPSVLAAPGRGKVSAGAGAGVGAGAGDGPAKAKAKKEHLHPDSAWARRLDYEAGVAGHAPPRERAPREDHGHHNHGSHHNDHHDHPAGHRASAGAHGGDGGASGAGNTDASKR